MTKNDADNLEERLRPTERYILAFAKAHPDLPFCWREFTPKYAHGTIRNVFSKLASLRLLELWCRSSDAYYILYIAGRKRTRQAVTVIHMGGKYNLKQLTIEDYVKYLDSLGWEEIWKVHDVVLCFQVEGLYEEVLKKGKIHPNEQSNDIQFLVIGWQNPRSLQVILHRTGTVTCYLKCGECPIEVTPEGLVDLSAFLGKVQTRLADALDASSTGSEVTSVPYVSNWVVTQWHYGRDGKSEISGKSLNVTYKTWSGALVRIYLKRHGKRLKPRKETIEQPRKTLPRAFFEKAVAD